MVLDNHAECKNAVLGLLDALAKIKNLAEHGGTTPAFNAIIVTAKDALDRHTPILPRLEPGSR